MNDDWKDLYARLQRATTTLESLAMREGVDEMEAARLRAKAEGVCLALDYMRGYQRGYL